MLNICNFWGFLGALAGSGINAFANQSNYEANERINAQNLKTQTDINNQSIALQHEMMAYNSPDQQLARLSNAGVNMSFLGGQSIDSGNYSSVPALGAATASPYLASVGDLGSPIAAAAAQYASNRAALAGVEKTKAETNAIEFQLKMDKLFKEPEIKKMLRAMDDQHAKSNAETRHIETLVKSGDLDNARKEIENRFLEPRLQQEIENLSQQYRIGEEQIKSIVADVALKTAQKENVTAQTAYQNLVNKLRQEHELIFFAKEAGSGTAGMLALILDMCGYSPDDVKQFVTAIKKKLTNEDGDYDLGDVITGDDGDVIDRLGKYQSSRNNGFGKQEAIDWFKDKYPKTKNIDDHAFYHYANIRRRKRSYDRVKKVGGSYVPKDSSNIWDRYAADFFNWYSSTENGAKEIASY